MRLVVGTYRGLTHLPECLESIERHVSGVDDIVFIDDGDDPVARRWMAARGMVVHGGGHGFAHTMHLACRVMRGDACAFWEEDFVVTRPVDLNELAGVTDSGHYAQVALLRQPWFPEEIEAGGILEMMQANGVPLQRSQNGRLWAHQGTFTTNPAVWSPKAWYWGWPQCAGSEAVKSTQLLEHDHLLFAYQDGIAVEHRGERSGHGY